MHLATASTKEEALDKIGYYLTHPDERKKIALQGQQYVYMNHTYERRVREVILPRLSIKAK
jgi:spore maturation protein CgeB